MGAPRSWSVRKTSFVIPHYRSESPFTQLEIPRRYGCIGMTIGDYSTYGYGCVPGKGWSYDVPGTGEEKVSRRTNFSPVPGTFAPILRRALRLLSGKLDFIGLFQRSKPIAQDAVVVINDLLST